MARILVMGGFAESLLNFRGAMLKEMVSLDNEVYACAPGASDEIKASLTKMGVTYCSISIDRTGMNPIQDLRTIINMVVLIKSLKPDMFLGYTIKPVVYGSMAAKIVGVPSVFSIITGLGYSFSADSIKGKLISRIVSVLYCLSIKLNKRVFFQNPDDLDLFRERGIVGWNNKATVINGSGVDIVEYSPAPYPSNISFLLIARLIKDKGIYEYAEAARKIREKYPKVKFRLAGWLDHNPSSIDCKDLQRWQVSGDIDFLGRLDDVRPAIASCSVYVLPSYREGTPRTVLEAMAMGRPIITTDAPGCRETVNQQVNGYLVPVRDIDGLVHAIEKFIVQPGVITQMGHASRLIAEEKYDVHKVNASILKAMGLT